MAKPALIELRENAIESAGILENIFGDRQKIDWPAIQDVADDTAQTIEKPHDTPLGPFAVHHKRLHLLNEPQMNKGDHCFWSPLPASRPRARGVHLLIEGMTDCHSQHCRLTGCDTTSLCLWKSKTLRPPHSCRRNGVLVIERRQRSFCDGRAGVEALTTGERQQVKFDDLSAHIQPGAGTEYGPRLQPAVPSPDGASSCIDYCEGKV
ncbi:hypothetical protein ACC728_34040 [Rhizobium ruizarguesonis]